MKSFIVECMTQYGDQFGRARQWGRFNEYTADTKADAIAQARRENHNGDCLSGRGLVWWRAFERTT